MAWRIELSGQARKDLRDLDPQDARRLLRFLHERIAPLEDVRSGGQPLKGSRFNGLWRYRLGDYRLIVSVDDQSLHVLVIRIGHRREIYER